MSQRKFLSALLLAGISIALTLLIHLGFNQKGAIAQDDPCFYQKSDGTIVDLRHLCGKQSGGRSQPSQAPQNPTASTMVQATGTTNPAMQITPPNDPGVLYISDSGGNNPGVQAARQSEHKGGK